jgi:hypothetical protein
MAAIKLLLALVVGSLLLLTTPARAESTPTVAELGQLLQRGSDFRVRTQAALALGASGKKEAVNHLCQGLGDDNATVRAAAAAALGRLSLGGRECLSKRLASEANSDVKSVIQRALERIEPPAAIGGDTKYYVAIGEVTNKTAQSNLRLNRTVRDALVKHIRKLSGFVVAPASETDEQAKALLAKHRGVKGIFLWPKVEATYSGGDLRLALELSLFSYPNKDFKGSMSRNLTMPGAQSPDPTSENEMIQMAAENLVPDLARNASRI